MKSFPEIKKLIIKVQERSSDNTVLQESMLSLQQKYGSSFENKGIDLTLGTCII